MKTDLKRRAISIAITTAMVLSLFAFAPQMGMGNAHARIVAYTLTLHWSSLDGEDIDGQKPIVIEDIRHGKTIDEVMAENQMELYDEHFKKSGYVDSEVRSYIPMSECSDWMQAGETEVNTVEDQVTKDVHIYCYMSKTMNEATLTVKAPLCGTQTTTDKGENGEWDISTQTNKPQVTAPKNANYGPLYSDSYPFVFWGTLNSGDLAPIETTFEEGNSYPATFLIMPDIGYQFTPDVRITVNGVAETSIADIGGLFIAECQVKAEHVWDGGRVTKKATTTATGVRTYTCNGCHATKTATIAKLPKKANTIKVNGKTVAIKYNKLKKKNQAFGRAKAITVSKPQGKVTYKKSTVTYTKAKSVKVSKKALNNYKKTLAKKIVVNSKTGKVTVKKGLKKGTYKVKVKVTAAGNANYKKATKTTTIKIVVK